ncbi:MAG TPA: NUDIX domain-containing protein [Candidatus Cybelea sp.]|nr:NUDIX domain-containing protein [Candidatus Cybelea sp.]
MARPEAAHVHLATGLALRDSMILLVASRYPNHAQPLWNLPGGRQQPGELLRETAIREIFEETGLRATIRELAYVSESYDRSANVHFINAAFFVEVTGDIAAPKNDHVVAVEWVAIDEIVSRIAVAVVREPLLAYLRGELPARYAGYEDAGITIEWPRDSA